MKHTVFALLMIILMISSLIPIGMGTERYDYSKKNTSSEPDRTGPSQERNSVGSIPEDVYAVEQEGRSETSTETPLQKEDEWNFNDTDEWRDLVYDEDNKIRLIVGLEGKTSSALLEIERISAEHQVEIVNKISIRGEVIAVVMELSFGSVTSLVEDIRRAELASYIEPDMQFQTQLVPNDPNWNLQWGPQKIGADWAWNTTVGDPSVLVAVVDTGVDYTHPDIAGNYVAVGYDWVNNDPDPIDDHGHGTHCAGIIAAVLNNSLGIAGVANVSIMAEKVLDWGGYGYADWVADGIINATDSGADIISMSIGSYGWGELLDTAVDYAYDSGVLLVAAAGNEDTNMKLYPAGYDQVVAVAATDQYDNTAWFSNWGDWIELAAPGVDIYSTVPWGYVSASGTSMACPHVAGVAALAWSLYPNRTRDWMRQWLRYTADDLGDEDFDIHFGYGRINAQKVVEEAPPAHELIVCGWEIPAYVEPGGTGRINATILNFGESSETDVAVQLLANDTMVDTASISSLAPATSTTASLTWTPTNEGLYNVTLYVVPVPDEEKTENNAISEYIYAGFPVKAAVLRSAGNLYSEVITNWKALNTEWSLFGDTMVYIDYTTLNKEAITYEDIDATEADVLIISCALEGQFTDSEIEAIERYTRGGHGLIATSGTFHYRVPNNNKLAPLFGLNETTMWTGRGTDLLHSVDDTHPIFAGVPDPLVFPMVLTALPYDGRWDSNELVGGEYLAMGHYEESAIVTFKGLVYVSPWLEAIPPHYHHHLQLLYNTIIWSTYQRPQHDLDVALEARERLQPGETSIVRATVFNLGLNNETDVKLSLMVNGTVVLNETIPQLASSNFQSFNYSWTPPGEGWYNITAYVPPMPDEDFAVNNVAGKMVYVGQIDVALISDASELTAITPILDSMGINYDIYNSNWVNLYTEDLSLLLYYPTVIFYQYNRLITPDEHSTLQSYLSSGGNLLVTGYDSLGSPSDPLLAEVVRSSTTGDDVGESELYVIDATHPIMNGPYGSFPVGYYISGLYSDCDLAEADTAQNAVTVAEMGDGYDKIIATEMLPGKVVYWNGRGTDDWTWNNDCEAMLKNMIAWFMRSEHELAVTLEAPSFLDLGSSSIVEATVHNFGVNNETEIELHLMIDGEEVGNKTIHELPTGESDTLTYMWHPTVEGTYNITAYAPPIAGEEFTANNIATKTSKVKPIRGFILFDQTHGTDSISSYSLWVSNLTERGYVVESHTSGPITSTVLQGYDAFVVPQARYRYLTNELSIVRDYVVNGGGLLVIGDGYPYIYTSLTSFAGITWTSGGREGETSDITSHPVTEGLDSAYFAVPMSIMYTESPAIDLVRDLDGNIMVAASSLMEGKILGIGDEDSVNDWWIGYSDNMRLANNMIDWLTAPRHEHDLAVSVSVPSSIELGTSVVVNATVMNIGLNNETDVELYLLVNGNQVENQTVPELLVDDSSILRYVWTPENTGEYNVSACVPPLPEEGRLDNNAMSREVGVFYYTRVYLPHRWVGDGTPMAWHYDDFSSRYTLPFDFPFYGIPHRTIYISSNGLITFIAPDISHNNSIPGLGERLAIAPAWDDWVTYYPHDIYIWESSTQIGIRWYVAASYDQSITADFEVILDAEGVIQFNYASNNGSVSATVGISNGVGHTIAEDVPSIDFINTIRFLPFNRDIAVQNVTASPSQVYAGEIVNINVTVANEGKTPESFKVRVYHQNESGSSSSTGFVASMPTEPHPANALWVEPLFKDLTDYNVGDRFNLTVWLNLTDLSFTWQIQLDFETTYLNARRAGYTGGSTSGFFAGHTTLPVDPTIDNTIGYVRHGETLIGSDYREAGYGSLCWIEFEVSSKPSEPYEGELYFHPHRTFVLDPDLRDVTITLYDGAYGFSVPPPSPPPPSPLIGEETVSLPPMSNETLSFAWNTTGLPLGSYTLIAVAVPVEGETDIEDNTFVDGTIEILWIHDIALAEFSAATTWVYQGWPVAFNITVKNKGDFSENFTVTLYYNLTSSDSIGTATIENLLPGENETITLLWDTTGVAPCHNYTITAVATMETSDSNPLDNIVEDGRVKIRFLGDVNGDDKIDMRDISAEARAFGSFPGHPRWNPDYDVNADSKIDMRDISMVARNFGICSQ